MIAGFGLLSNYDDADVAMSDFLLTLWTNFAKYHNPTPSPVTPPTSDADEVSWSEFEADEHNYLWIGSEVVEECSNYRQDYYAFHEYYFPYLAYGEEMP